MQGMPTGWMQCWDSSTLCKTHSAALCVRQVITSYTANLTAYLTANVAADETLRDLKSAVNLGTKVCAAAVQFEELSARYPRVDWEPIDIDVRVDPVQYYLDRNCGALAYSVQVRR